MIINVNKVNHIESELQELLKETSKNYRKVKAASDSESNMRRVTIESIKDALYYINEVKKNMQ